MSTIADEVGRILGMMQAIPPNPQAPPNVFEMVKKKWEQDPAAFLVEGLNVAMMAPEDMEILKSVAPALRKILTSRAAGPGAKTPWEHLVEAVVEKRMKATPWRLEAENMPEYIPPGEPLESMFMPSEANPQLGEEINQTLARAREAMANPQMFAKRAMAEVIPENMMLQRDIISKTSKGTYRTNWGEEISPQEAFEMARDRGRVAAKKRHPDWSIEDLDNYARSAGSYIDEMVLQGRSYNLQKLTPQERVFRQMRAQAYDMLAKEMKLEQVHPLLSGDAPFQQLPFNPATGSWGAAPLLGMREDRRRQEFFQPAPTSIIPGPSTRLFR